MATIADVTEDRPSAGAGAPDAIAPQRSVLSAERVAGRRSLLVPVLSTACAALITGVLALAVVGFNTLRDDIRSLDAKIDTQIGMLRDDIRSLDAKTDSQIGSVRGEIGSLRSEIGEVNAILLDHTERLARIETTMGVVSPPAQQPN